jgi:hypothetical protein
MARTAVLLSLGRAPALPPQHAYFGSQSHTPYDRCLRFGPRVTATPARLAPVLLRGCRRDVDDAWASVKDFREPYMLQALTDALDRASGTSKIAHRLHAFVCAGKLPI